jgi:hypothetical protein
MTTTPGNASSNLPGKPAVVDRQIEARDRRQDR